VANKGDEPDCITFSMPHASGLKSELQQVARDVDLRELVRHTQTMFLDAEKSSVSERLKALRVADEAQP
jgi:hypothetical protein